MNVNLLDKKIWIYWSQGFDVAPWIVKQCVTSWKLKNPDWELIQLDDKNVFSYIDFNYLPSNYNKLSLAHKSDLLRLNLLIKYGGVWVDATTLCNVPLDNWLYNYFNTDFPFMFREPGVDRVISNWFIASRAGNPILINLRSNLVDYWNNIGSKVNTKNLLLIRKLSNRVLLRMNFYFASLSTSYFFSKCLKIDTYFCFHYIFYKTLRDLNLLDCWNSTAGLQSSQCQFFLKKGLLNKFESDLDFSSTPLFKLTWKLDLNNDSIQGTNIAYLLKIFMGINDVLIRC